MLKVNTVIREGLDYENAAVIYWSVTATDDAKAPGQNESLALGVNDTMAEALVAIAEFMQAVTGLLDLATDEEVKAALEDEAMTEWLQA